MSKKRADDKGAGKSPGSDTEQRAQEARKAAADLRAKLRGSDAPEPEPVGPGDTAGDTEGDPKAERKAGKAEPKGDRKAEPKGDRKAEPKGGSKGDRKARKADKKADEKAGTRADQVAAPAQTPSSAGEPPHRPPLWQRHDVLVVILAATLVGLGAGAERCSAEPELRATGELGLHVEVPGDWLPRAHSERSAGGLLAAARDQIADKRSAGSDTPTVHQLYASPTDPVHRIELRIGARPASGALKSALALARIGQYGEAVWAAPSTERTIGGRDWVRTRYRYAYEFRAIDEPQVVTGIEYATINGGLLYVVTVHGDDAVARRLERLIVPTLAVDANHPAAVGSR